MQSSGTVSFNHNQSMKSFLFTIGLSFVLGSSAHAAGYTPIPLTPGSFNFDIVVESNYLALPCQYTVTATMDSAGPTGTPPGNNAGNTFYEIGVDYAAATTGLPHANTLLTNPFATGHVYLLPPSWKTNNCLYIGNYTNIPVGFANPYTSAAFTLTSPAAYGSLSFLTTAGNGPCGLNCVVSHQDGTTETNAVSVPDWFGGPTTPAYAAKGRVVPNTGAYSNVGTTTAVKLYSIDLALVNTTSPVTNIFFSYVSGGRAAVFSVSGGSDGVNFSPIAVTGYNADTVVEAAPSPLPYNATMDNGTNITVAGAGANTWYEVGWNPAAPTTGFPAHGSILVSTNTGRSYQMPASYTGPMSVLIDTNHQTANITPANPQPYTAFSLLTAGASIGAANTMTNLIILQHADGTAETNLFLGYDWFSGQPAAYSASGRVSFSTARAVNNVGTVNPRLFESQFQMANTTSPVTNIVLKYFQAGGVNWTTYVLAVSATAGGIPVSIASSTPAQNVYPGQTAQFSATIAFGTSPVYQWQIGTPGGSFVNLSDGGNISGSTTPNLSVANVSAADVAYYQLVVTNAVTTNLVTSTPAPLTLRVSTSTNVVQAGDPITDFGGLQAASPAGQTPASAIDSTLAKFLTYGAGASNSPWAGPVGLVVSPQAGNTVLDALRFYVGNDHPERDPADYLLEGSTDGVNFTTISSGALALPDVRNIGTTSLINITNQVLEEIDFANTIGYTTYRVTFNNTKTNATANSLQIGEIQFLGNLSLIGPGIVKQPAPAQTVFVGGSFSTTVLGNGPQPLSYQWYFNGATLIPNATNATYSLSNAQLANAGNYSCTISNPYGSTNTTALALTVLAPPSSYASTVMGDHPVAYLRLDETPDNGAGDNGTVAYDYAGAHNGTYSNVNLGVPGYSVNDPGTAVTFGSFAIADSLVDNIQGINFGAPTNGAAAFSLEAWVFGSLSQAFDAGIVTLGPGGGGEQFSIDCGGGTSHPFRFYYRDAATGVSHVLNSTTAPTDSKWHHVVAVLDQVHSNQVLYVDGAVAASAVVGSGLGVQSVTGPVVIGARRSSATTNYNNQFYGNIDNVAIYNYALGSNQVVNHYFSAGIAPFLTTSPTNTAANEGTSVTFHSAANGTPTLAFLWYASDGANPTTVLAGQTSNDLVLGNVTAAMNGNFYQVVVTNSYGSVTGAPVQLTVASGPPSIQTDVLPQYFTYSGYPLTLSATVTGSAPFTYGWKLNGSPLTDNGRITGSHSNALTIAGSQLADSGNYQLFVTNAQGFVSSSVAAVTVSPVLGFNVDGIGWSVNGGATFVAGNTNVLQLTDNLGNEARSSFFTYPVYVGGFKATWTYTLVNPGANVADGVVFVVQNDPRGAAALGSAGGNMGYGGASITPSAALEFNIYPGAPGGIGISLDTNGVIGTSTLPAPVAIDSGDPINVTVTSLNGVVSLVLRDTLNNNTFSTSALMNVPSVVGTNTAYVGFTGGTGGAFSTQQVSNFTFTSLVGISTQVTGPNTLLVSWPAGVGGYVLQQNSDLGTTNWQAVTAPVNVVNGQNQVTVSTAGGMKFYRLGLAQ
jgi:hypothetical protein